MITRPPKQVLESLLRLKQNVDFKNVMDNWLKPAGKELDEACRDCSDTPQEKNLSRTQGAAKTMDLLLSEIEQAAESVRLEQVKESEKEENNSRARRHQLSSF